MYSNFKEQAINYVRQAVAEDHAGNYAKAFPLYMNALEYFKTSLKYEKNPTIKEAITHKFMEYLRRAEEIRAVLDEGGSGLVPNGDAAVTTTRPKDGNDAEIRAVLDEGGSGPASNRDAAVPTRPKTKPKDGTSSCCCFP